MPIEHFAHMHNPAPPHKHAWPHPNQYFDTSYKLKQIANPTKVHSIQRCNIEKQPQHLTVHPRAHLAQQLKTTSGSFSHSRTTMDPKRNEDTIKRNRTNHQFVPTDFLKIAAWTNLWFWDLEIFWFCWYQEWIPEWNKLRGRRGTLRRLCFL